ncbi:hypothetical protein ACF1AO_29835 [Streptomyces longwoodensis]|uniref:hypothetical protein n=1 Tax=Streptomyces longwoodensis TaxID=68231 RepID=UPI0036FD0F09
MDDAGTPFLVDLTFLTRLDQAVSVVVATPGYATLDEEIRGEPPNPFKDCLGADVLARVLLLPHTPMHRTVQDLAAAARQELTAAGYSDDVVACLMQALDPVPARRPSPLLPWAQELRRLVAACPDPGRRRVALSTDAFDRPVAAVGGDRGLRWYTGAAPDAHPAGGPLPPGHGGPLDVRELATVRDARGITVTAAADGTGLLWTARPGEEWTAHTGDARGLAVLTSPRGEVLIWTARHDELLRLRLLPDGSAAPQEVLPAVPGSRVLAAAWDATGHTALLVAEPDRVTHCTWPARPGGAPERATVHAELGVDRGSIALHRGWGELEAVLVTQNGTRTSLSRHHSGAPWASVECVRELGTQVELCGIRQGIARLTAGPHRLTVVTETSAAVKEKILHTGPARLADLHVGHHGDLRVAALVEGKVRCWVETWAEAWELVAIRQS